MAKKVLAVDDDPMIRGLLREILTAQGFEVTLAENGPAGLEALNQPELKEGLSLIILDVVMPGLNGLEVLTRVKEGNLAPSIPVIMLTGEARTEDILDGYNRGADYYITKPFTRQQLMHGVTLVSETV